MKINMYSQTCLKGSSKGMTKSGFLRQVTLNTGSFALYFGSMDPENVAASLNRGDHISKFDCIMTV